MNLISINIETLVLIAVWNHPFIFQGYFKITEINGQSNQVLLFRCEYVKSSCMDVIDNEFSPYDYTFTHLYNESKLINLDALSHHNEYAIYLLKYSLHTTLLKMIQNTKQYLVSMDEVAMQSIVELIKPRFSQAALCTQNNNDIGFAVAMDFSPTEEMGQSAALSLLGKINSGHRGLH